MVTFSRAEAAAMPCLGSVTRISFPAEGNGVSTTVDCGSALNAYGDLLLCTPCFVRRQDAEQMGANGHPTDAMRRYEETGR